MAVFKKFQRTPLFYRIFTGNCHLYGSGFNKVMPKITKAALCGIN